MGNIILITHWTAGDVFPFIKIGSALKKRGHDVTVFTHCYFEKHVVNTGLAFEAIDTLQEYEEMRDDLHLLLDPIINLEGLLHFNKKYHGKEKLVFEVNKIIEKCECEDTVIIARHRSSISGLLAAEKMRIPVCTVILAPNYLAHMELHEELFGEHILSEINAARQEIGLESITNWSDWMLAPKKMIAVWPDWFEFPEEEWPDTLVPIGFLDSDSIETQNNVLELEEIVHENKPVALITGGSSKMIRSDFYSIAANACYEAGFNGILVTEHDEYVPEPLPKGIIRLTKVKLSKLMEQVNVVIHHGGMGTISEALHSGKPQVILPHVTDGPDNAYRLVELGVAFSFPPIKWDVQNVAGGLMRSQLEDIMERCQYYANKKVSYNTNEALVKNIEEMIQSTDYFL